MLIRSAKPHDLKAVKHCAEQAFAKYVAAIGRKPAPMIANFAAHQRHGQLFVLVDEQNNLHGYIVFYPKGRSMFLENLAVLPIQTGKGYGGKLVRFCENAAAKMACDKVYLYTNAVMTDNFSFYAALGYAETERRIEQGFHRVYFEKPTSYAKNKSVVSGNKSPR